MEEAEFVLNQKLAMHVKGVFFSTESLAQGSNTHIGDRTQMPNFDLRQGRRETIKLNY